MMAQSVMSTCRETIDFGLLLSLFLLVSQERLKSENIISERWKLIVGPCLAQKERPEQLNELLRQNFLYNFPAAKLSSAVTIWRKKGMGSPIEYVGFVVGALFLGWALRTGMRLWWTPRKLQKEIRASGIDGTSYSLRFHGIREMMRLRKEASAKPMSFSHDIASRVLPFQLQLAKTYGLCLSHYRFIYLSRYISLSF